MSPTPKLRPPRITGIVPKTIPPAPPPPAPSPAGVGATWGCVEFGSSQHSPPPKIFPPPPPPPPSHPPAAGVPSRHSVPRWPPPPLPVPRCPSQPVGGWQSLLGGFWARPARCHLGTLRRHLHPSPAPPRAPGTPPTPPCPQMRWWQSHRVVTSPPLVLEVGPHRHPCHRTPAGVGQHGRHHLRHGRDTPGDIPVPCQRRWCGDMSSALF